MEQGKMQAFSFSDIRVHPNIIIDILEKNKDVSLMLRREGDRVTVYSHRTGGISASPKRIGPCQENRHLLEAINSACYDADADEQLLHQKKRCYHRKLIKDNEQW